MAAVSASGTADAAEVERRAVIGGVGEYWRVSLAVTFYRQLAHPEVRLDEASQFFVLHQCRIVADPSQPPLQRYPNKPII
jgi:hypothetical protein